MQAMASKAEYMIGMGDDGVRGTFPRTTRGVQYALIHFRVCESSQNKIIKIY